MRNHACSRCGSGRQVSTRSQTASRGRRLTPDTRPPSVQRRGLQPSARAGATVAGLAHLPPATRRRLRQRLARLVFGPAACPAAGRGLSTRHPSGGGVPSTRPDPPVRRLALVCCAPVHRPRVAHGESTARPDASGPCGRLGGARERVVVMDEAQGHSGQRRGTRVGVQRGCEAVGPVGLMRTSRASLARAHQTDP